MCALVIIGDCELMEDTWNIDGRYCNYSVQCASGKYRHTMEISNLIIIPLLGSMILSSSKQHHNNKSIVYTSEDLRNIRDNVCHDQYYRKLLGQIVKTIRNLRKNNKKKKKRGSKVGRISKT